MNVPALVKHNFRIHARRMFDRLGVQLFLFEEIDGARLGVCEIIQSEQGPYIKRTVIDRPHEATVLDEASGFKPFLIIDEPLYRELLSAMVRLADDEGLPRPSEDHMKGKLEATQSHLKDVQNMLQFATQLINRKEVNKYGLNRSSEGSGDQGHGLLESTERPLR